MVEGVGGRPGEWQPADEATASSPDDGVESVTAPGHSGGALDLEHVVAAGPAEAERFLHRVAVTNARSSLVSTPSRSDRAWDLGVGAVLLVLAAVLPLFRQTGTASWNTVWAEDGTIYAQQAIRGGGFHVLFRGYAGYEQLPPRLLALVTPWFSIRHLALYCAVAGVVVAALLAWFVYRMARGWISSPLARLVLASFVVLTPALGAENTANIVNTIWVFLAVAPWALVALEERRRDTLTRSVVVFLAATATPLCVLYLPVAVVWVAFRRTRSAAIVAATFCVGLAVQAVVVLTTTDTDRLVIRETKVLRDAIGQRVFAVFLLGPKWATQLWFHNWRLSALGSTIVVVAVIIALLPRAGRSAQVLAVAFVFYAVVMFAVPVWGRGTYVLGLVEGQRDSGATARFDVVPVILLAAGVALLLGPVGGRPRRWIARYAIPVFVAQVAVLTIVNFSVANFRSHDADWTHKVTAIYAAQCVGEPPGRLVTIPNTIWFSISPEGSFPVTVPCRNLAP